MIKFCRIECALTACLCSSDLLKDICLLSFPSKHPRLEKASGMKSRLTNNADLRYQVDPAKEARAFPRILLMLASAFFSDINIQDRHMEVAL